MRLGTKIYLASIAGALYYHYGATPEFKDKVRETASKAASSLGPLVVRVGFAVAVVALDRFITKQINRHFGVGMVFIQPLPLKNRQIAAIAACQTVFAAAVVASAFALGIIGLSGLQIASCAAIPFIAVKTWVMVDKINAARKPEADGDLDLELM